MSSAATKIFHDYLKKRELRNTAERFTILAEITRIQNHFEADTLLVRLKTKHKKISRATIYRTLDLLIDCGLVKKINFNKPVPQAMYEPITAAGLARHDHFICQECGKIIEFYDKRLKKIQVNLQAAYQLEVLHYSYHLYGRCAACKNQRNLRQ
jgi:Fur family ferric uptake transcriptional regulator